MEYKSSTLYTKVSSGKVKQWNITVTEKLNKSVTTITTGYLTGTLTKYVNFTYEGKNVGKANATSHYTQAVKEAKSKYTHKLKEGYKELSEFKDTVYELDTLTVIGQESRLLEVLQEILPINKTDENNRLKPMKAQPFKENKLKYPVLGQYKINGVRVFIRREELEQLDLFTQDSAIGCVLRSKEGLRYNIQHLEEQFNKLWLENNIDEDFVLDGEIYIPNVPVTTIGGAARNPNNINHANLGIVLFDYAIENYIQEDRLLLLSNLKYNKLPIDNNPHNNTRLDCNISALEPTIINNDNEALAFAKECIELGFEGSIFRDKYAEYRFGSRPVTMMKLKFKKDKEFKLIDIVGTDKANHNGLPLALFVCQNDVTKDTFTVTPQGYSNKERANILSNKSLFIGKLVTVFYYERTKNKLPFHANGHIRDYE